MKSSEPRGAAQAVVRTVWHVTPGTTTQRGSEGATTPRSQPVVVKIGGRSLEAPGALSEFAAEVAALSGAALLVHGGGHDVSAWCERLGVTPAFIDGLRVTDPATLDVAVAVLAGLANKRLVAALRAAGVDAVGLSGADGLVAVEPHSDPRLGAVGRVTAVNRVALDALLAAGARPVLASIGEHRGALVNINADDFAAAVAGVFASPALVLLSDAPGLVLDGELVPTLAAAAIDAALAHPNVDGGMVPKLHAARDAIDAGAQRVTIAAWNGPGTLRALIDGSGGGTTVTARRRSEVLNG